MAVRLVPNPDLIGTWMVVRNNTLLAFLDTKGKFTVTNTKYTSAVKAFLRKVKHNVPKAHSL